MTKRLALLAFAMVLATAAIVPYERSAEAQSTGEKLYKTKCAVCHGADGSGNTLTGKTFPMRDLRSPEVQKQTDVQLIEVIAKGKKHMPGYEKSLKEAQIKDLVAYIRQMAKEEK